MFGIHWRRATTLLLAGLIAAGLALGTVSCGGSSQPSNSAKTSAQASRPRSDAPLVKTANISEVSPPATIQELQETLEQYQPQVEILSPKADAVLEDNSVAVQLQVADLPLFKDAKLGLGSHLHVLLDNQTYQAVYDVSQPIVFSDLTPGTHTIRAFASRPWHESFKNEGAYAQVTFHVFTKTKENNPDPRQPLLTYSRPQGTYGAEPIMLDFYLANAPLHLIAQADDEVDDWRIRCTVNGTSFIVDRWQPLYLQGFKPGKNWVQLELLDQQGQPINNAFNTTTRIVDYEPGGKDTLSKLIRGELKAADVRGIVGAQPTASPKPSASPTPSPSPTPKASPSPPKTPAAEQPVKKLPVVPPVVPIVPLPEKLSPAPPVAPKEIAPPAPKKEKPGGLLSRFRKEAKETPSPEPTVAAPKVTKTVPQPEKSLAPEVGDRPQPTATPAPKLSPSPQPELVVPPKVAPKPIEPKATPAPELAPAPKPTKFEAKPTPKPSPTITTQPLTVKTPDLKPSPDLVKPLPLKTVPEADFTKPATIPSAPPEPPAPVGKFKGFLDRFRQPEQKPTSTATPKSTSTLTEPKVAPSPKVVPTPKPAPAATKFESKPIPKASPTLTPQLTGQQTPQPVLLSPKIEPKLTPKPSQQIIPQVTPKPVVAEPAKAQPTPEPEKSLPTKPEAATIAPVKPPTAVSPLPKPESPAPVKKLKGFLDRFRKPDREPSATIAPKVQSPPVLTKPEIAPSPKPMAVESPKLPTPKAEKSSELKTSQPTQPAIQPDKSAGFLERLRQRSAEQNQDKKQLNEYLNRNRPNPQTPSNLAVPSVLPAIEVPAQPPSVKLPVPSGQLKPVPTVKPTTVKLPAVPQPAITSAPSKTLTPNVQATPAPERLKVFSPPPQPSGQLKIIRPEETPNIPSRYLKKPDSDQADQ